MKVVNTGKRYDLYDDSLKTFDALPAKTYVVRFNPKMGFWLDEYSEIKVKEDKIYGEHEIKVVKVLQSFARMDRNMGVILSGDKGIGKSLFAKLLMEKAVLLKLPVIIVDSFIPGIASYLETIEQEVMVVFDEFDKTFADVKVGDNEADPQAAMLSLFDGVSQGKKLFVVTCNSLTKLSDYLVNRPGRFHYHFRFTYPSDQEITNYLQDKLDPEFYSEIEEVVKFSKKVNLNYDCLRAIAFELNTGLPFGEAIKDLNILNLKNQIYEVTMYCKNGIVCRTNHTMDMFADDEIAIYFKKNGWYACMAHFETDKCAYDPATGNYIVKGEDITIGDETDSEEEQMKEREKYTPEYCVISLKEDRKLYYKV